MCDYTRTTLNVMSGGFYPVSHRTPYYVNGKFIADLVEQVYDNDPQYRDQFNRRKFALILQSVRKSRGTSACLYCQNGFQFRPRFDDPMAFLQWVEGHGFSFRVGPLPLLYDARDMYGYVESSGNLQEYSSAFCFRIYDEELVKNVRRQVTRIAADMVA